MVSIGFVPESVDSSTHSAGASVLDHRDIVWPKASFVRLCISIQPKLVCVLSRYVLTHTFFRFVSDLQLQVLKDKYLQDMKDLHGMLTTRSTMVTSGLSCCFHFDYISFFNCKLFAFLQT